MKATPENKIKKMLVEYLDSIHAFHYPASAGAFSVAGIPDRVGTYRGFFFGCECKAPGKKATALQVQCKNRIEAAGGQWFLIDGLESMELLKEWVAKINKM
ncbi:MAG TPA: hypothetical protein DCS07_12820 [Bdellovibrionales bacterium]|nr:hypothetical protein [Bdellovibrionales bacterium]